METTVRSADGTTISYLTYGAGPGLVVVPGATRRAYHYAALATALAGTHAVHVVDRRGRGASGPQGSAYGLDREAEDVLAVLDATGSAAVFGHSYGGLIALESALVRPLSALVVYEPGVSLDGGLDDDFVAPFNRAVARGHYAGAMARLMVGIGVGPRGVPAAALTPLGWLMMRGPEGDVLRETLRTVPAEVAAGLALDSDGRRYAAITTPTLLMGGGRSPAWLLDALAGLHRIIGGSSLIIRPPLDHNAPDQNAPEDVAGLVRAFLAPAESIP